MWVYISGIAANLLYQNTEDEARGRVTATNRIEETNPRLVCLETGSEITLVEEPSQGWQIIHNTSRAAEDVLSVCSKRSDAVKVIEDLATTLEAKDI